MRPNILEILSLRHALSLVLFYIITAARHSCSWYVIRGFFFFFHLKKIELGCIFVPLSKKEKLASLLHGKQSHFHFVTVFGAVMGVGQWWECDVPARRRLGLPGSPPAFPLHPPSFRPTRIFPRVLARCVEYASQLCLHGYCQ